MLAARTLSVYVAREVLQYTTLGFVLITSVMVSQNLLRRVEDMVVVGFTAADFLVVLRCLLAMLTAYGLPVSFLFGALLAVRRFASDSEVLAMRSCGLGTRTLLIPTLLVGIAVSILTGYLILGIQSDARADLRAIFTSVAARGSILVPGEFRSVGSRLIFVAKRTRDNELHSVVISDRSTPNRPFVVFAERGKFSLDQEQAIVRIELQQGDIHLESPEHDPDSYKLISFDSFDYRFSLSELVGGAVAVPTAKEMGTADLLGVVVRTAAGDSSGLVNEPIEYELQLQRRLALPFAPLFFAVTAVALGVRSSRGGTAWSAASCAVIAFGYYALLSFSQVIARDGWIPAAIALWLPNLLLASLAAALLLLERHGPRR
jgi:LPS export ABC transporter permease LptF